MNNINTNGFSIFLQNELSHTGPAWILLGEYLSNQQKEIKPSYDAIYISYLNHNKKSYTYRIMTQSLNKTEGYRPIHLLVVILSEI